tara:strand:- start:263 stop:589 length:327 start_codon:yes stop_codon:yes gene_type:complete
MKIPSLIDNLPYMKGFSELRYNNSMEDEDDIRMSQVVKYIHHSIMFEELSGKISYDKAADNTFDWIVSEVYKLKNKECNTDDDKECADAVLFDKIDKETSHNNVNDYL